MSNPLERSPSPISSLPSLGITRGSRESRPVVGDLSGKTVSLSPSEAKKGLWAKICDFFRSLFSKKVAPETTSPAPLSTYKITVQPYAERGSDRIDAIAAPIVQGRTRGLSVNVSARNLQIPPDSLKSLANWYQNNNSWDKDPKKSNALQQQRNENLQGKGKADSHGNIIPTESHINEAITKFVSEYKGSWSEMKHHCTDKGMMQIINDLRSSELNTIFTQLKSEYTNLQINDFGSANLTSDKDFAFQIKNELNQTKEAEVVTKFNEIFQKRWNVASAVIFDSNAYTMQYLIKAQNPEIEGKRQTQQKVFSWVMKFRLGDEESNQEYIDLVVGEIENEDEKSTVKELMESAANRTRALNYEVKKEMLLGAYRGASPIEGGTRNQEEIFIEEFNIESASQKDIKEFNNLFNDLKEQIGDQALDERRIRAENNLHEDIKTSFEQFEKGFVSLQKNLDNLANSKDGDQFKQRFDRMKEEIMGIYEAKIEDTSDPEFKESLQEELDRLENTSISDEDRDQVFEAYTQYKGLCTDREENITKLHEIQSHKTHLEHLISQRETSQGEKLIKLEDSIRERMTKLKESLGYDVKSHLSESELIEKSDEAIASYQSKKEEYDESIKEFSRDTGNMMALVTAFFEAKDNLLLHSQRIQLEGMCFAQEAHVSEGAFAGVVLDYQGGQYMIRTLNQGVQAFVEVSAFFKAHQKKGKDSEKLVESSKYGIRLAQFSRIIVNRAITLGVSPPQIDQDRMKKFDLLMGSLGDIRGKGKTPQQVEAAVKQAVGYYLDIAPAQVNDESIKKVLYEVNKFILKTSAKVDAWCLSPEVAEKSSILV